MNAKEQAEAPSFEDLWRLRRYHLGRDLRLPDGRIVWAPWHAAPLERGEAP